MEIKINQSSRKHKRRLNAKELLDRLIFPDYKQLVDKVERKVGKMPVRPSDLPKGSWSEQALRVLSERYLMRNKDGEVFETPEDMCWRVSWEMASAESLWGKTKEQVESIARDFYELLISRKFLPNSPTLMNGGTRNNLQFSACFVLPVEDSMEGIFDALKNQALIHKSGGGTGFSFTRLRPRGAVVKTSSGTASGPVSFMRVFDAATSEVKQGGKRRGANMGILRVDHPDIQEFIHCKDTGGITNFNISVAISDKFMEALEKGEDYDLLDPRDGKKVGSLNAREVFDEIAESAWRTGDPGLVFIDRINKGTANPVPGLGPVESTNPCGEQPLYPFDSCNLGSIFLKYFVRDVDGRREVDWENLKVVTRKAVRFMDDVIEMNPYPLEPIKRISLGIRRIGLGVGGWADMLIDLGIPYDSEEALELGRKVMKVISDEAVLESRRLARERGAFPLWRKSIYRNEEPRRNSTVTTIAPTGSISIIADTSGGIEPIFAISYRHIVRDKHLDRTLTFVNPRFEEIAWERGFWSESVKEAVMEKGTVREIEEVPEDVRKVFGTAHEISFDWHIKMQAAFQEYTENAVSKTINLRNESEVVDVREAYKLAWENGCEGITVFRDGSKDVQVLNLGADEKKKEEVVSEVVEDVWTRPMIISGSTYKIATPVGTAFITVNHDEKNNPVEVFINIGRAGSDIQAMAEALGRLISKSLKFGNHMDSRERAMTIIDQLRGIGGRTSVGFGAGKIRSLPDAVAVALGTHLGVKVNGNSHEGNGVANHDGNHNNHHANGNGNSDLAKTLLVENDNSSLEEEFLSLNKTGDICPSCGSSTFVYEEGCSKCYACGYSEC